jgi:hypothetical protein
MYTLTALFAVTEQQIISNIIEKSESMSQEPNHLILEPSMLIESKVEKKDGKKEEKKNEKKVEKKVVKTCDEDESACTYDYCKAHPDFKWCTRKYCYNFLNKEKP